MEKSKLQTVLETYTRYLVNLKQNENSSNENFKEMKAFIQENCDECLKTHMIQDAYLNMLRQECSKYDEIQPSSAISLIMESQDNMDKVLELLQTTNPIEEKLFQVLKEKYYRLIDETNLEELSWSDYNKFKNIITNEIVLTSSIPTSVKQRMQNVLKVKMEKAKWRLLVPVH